MEASPNAKLREALRSIKKINDGRPHDAAGYEINDIITEALAIPRLQCEVGTPIEQERRFRCFCYAHRNLERGCGDCPLLNEVASCKFVWGQLPYEGK